MLYPSTFFVCMAVLAFSSVSIPSKPIVFQEKKGFVQIEAEQFSAQEKDDVRKWYLITTTQSANLHPDGDSSHATKASGHAYLEILPDTRRTHDDSLHTHVNFTDDAGRMAVLSYKIRFKTPGRYYVWARAYSTGSEDNGLHVGLDGQFPESGKRMQWCDGKNTWRWESKQRTAANHCGEPFKIYLDIPKAGIHTIQFSMREDGFEFDTFLLTTDKDFKPA